jgi:hypothetical protein
MHGKKQVHGKSVWYVFGEQTVTVETMKGKDIDLTWMPRMRSRFSRSRIASLISEATEPNWEDT